MGSSSKKHKSDKSKDSRKRKHRSRSRSPTERTSRSELPERSERDREKHRHSKKHHKEKKRDKHSPSARDRNDYSNRLGKPQDSDSDDGYPTAPPPPKISRSSPPSGGAPAAASSSSDNSLSIAETNKLRAKLGLKPLQPAPSEVEEGSSTKSASELMGGKDMGEFVHKPAESLSQRKREEKIRSRLTERKEKRAIDAKLSSVRGIADEDSGDEDAAAWVKRNRQIQQEKDKAEKRAKMLEELDAEFGVGELVQDEFRNDASSAYSTRDLRGLKVEHSLDNFKEGRAVVLTLKDKGVLDEDDDVLVNVNIQDDERYRKNNERKKLKPNLHGYNAYDEESVDEFGNVQKSLLGKYDEEIGEEKKSSFVIGKEAEIERRQKEAVSIREKLQRKKLESLATAGLQLASEYYTPEEMVQFKKPKKKVRKIRKKVLKASDLESSVPEDAGKDLATRVRDKPQTSKGGFKPVLGEAQDDRMEVEQGDSDGGGEEFHLDIDDMPPPMEDLSNVRLEPDEGELELQLALNKARKLKQREDLVARPSTAEVVALSVLRLKQEPRDDEEGGHGGNITLNATAEFCRTLGDIPTYGLAGNRDEDAEELMDFEREMTEERRREAEERQQQRGAWAEVEVDEAPVEIAPPEAPILDEEPDVGAGVAGALRLAVSKGYLEKETSNRPSASRMHHLQAQNYSIEDKTHLDDDKFGRRERYAGPTSDFKEKDGFKPNVKLDYIDDDGRVLNAKEAFRYLSHKFHGKGPGKNKVEKRMKKVEQEVLMKQMSSTDTPLGTLNMLQQKQKETHSPYVVLSGSKQLQSISKTKM